MVEWMKEHQAEIVGLDRNRPLLPQLDESTDDRLQAVARGMDPMAN